MWKNIDRIIFFSLLFCGLSVYAQTKEELKSQKLNIENEIEKTKKLLNIYLESVKKYLGILRHH